MSLARAPSLKVRALRWLAQREHSRAELRVKLLRLGAPAAAAATDQEAAHSSAANPDLDTQAQAEVDALLDWLSTHGYLSEARFVESRVYARAARFGNRRIEHELRQKGVVLDAAAKTQLAASELERARAVWQRKFGTQAAPADAATRLRQMRFLAARGFGADVARQVVQEGGRSAE